MRRLVFHAFECNNRILQIRTSTSSAPENFHKHHTSCHSTARYEDALALVLHNHTLNHMISLIQIRWVSIRCNCQMRVLRQCCPHKNSYTDMHDNQPADQVLGAAQHAKLLVADDHGHGHSGVILRPRLSLHCRKVPAIQNDRGKGASEATSVQL